jgi:hypothetical protein
MAYDNDRTTRIGYLCFTIVALGIIGFFTKDCNIMLDSCNATSCYDEFLPFDGNNSKQCSSGAKGEVVNATPDVLGPKGERLTSGSPPGILCHCINSPGKAGRHEADAGDRKVID